MSGERVQRWPAIARRYSNNITIFAQATQCLHHNGYPDLKVVPIVTELWEGAGRMAPALEGEFPEAQLDLLNQLLQSSEFKALLLERDLRIGVCVEMEEKPGMLFTIVSIC